MLLFCYCQFLHFMSFGVYLGCIEIYNYYDILLAGSLLLCNIFHLLLQSYFKFHLVYLHLKQLLIGLYLLPFLLIACGFFFFFVVVIYSFLLLSSLQTPGSGIPCTKKPREFLTTFKMREPSCLNM